MSTKIGLRFEKSRDTELERKLKRNGCVIRLTSDVMFRGKSEWIGPYSAIVDTGAHISVIPRRIWSKSDVKIFADHEMRGIVPINECSIPVIVGEIDAMVVDEKDNTKEISVLCYFALTDEIPLILGFKTLLEEFECCFNYRENRAFIID